MIIRQLINGDATFGLGVQNFLTGQNAIAENIQTNLYCFLRDCYFDIQKGLDWIRFFSVPTSAQEIQLSVKSAVLLCYGVTSINSIDVSVENRKINISMNINTIFTSNFQYNLEYVPIS
jgi:hypothetical protein